MQNHFLKQLQHFLRNIENPEQSAQVPQKLADYLFSNQVFLDESDITLDLINALGDWLEGKPQNLNQLYLSLYLFWLTALARNGIDIFYFGELNKLQMLGSRFRDSAINNLCYLSHEETDQQEISAFHDKITASTAPFILYDPQGLKLALAVEHPQAIGCISFYDLLIDNFIPLSTAATQYTHLLAQHYTALANPDVKTVIIGNSYSFYGFPERLLENSVNISTHSLGLKQARQLTAHILERYPHVENFVYCLGFFDLYSDLLKTKDDFNQQIIHAWSQLNSHYRIKPEDGITAEGMQAFSRLVMPTPVQGQTINGLEDSHVRAQICESARLIFARSDSLSAIQQQEEAQKRGISHSKSVKHRATLAENKQLVAEMSVELATKGKKVIWLTPSFPAAYVDNLDAEMKQTHRQYFADLEGAHSRFIDLSEHPAFEREDFRDGDHLNYLGAGKMIGVLRALGVGL
ncbi:hypothetical protein [Cedecea sp. NFIX57]|uniref:hypothetical protein n=1 Tax=Cedecea sp. NFIX57 TaxID=1566286 RepID=UPI000A0A4466|nr:hypothetical protein [Cedecea sp. NFIX57]SMG30367.1 hypothetical protein SAMN03159353_1006221 [Cedecea sp. NFIX57]